MGLLDELKSAVSAGAQAGVSTLRTGLSTIKQDVLSQLRVAASSSANAAVGALPQNGQILSAVDAQIQQRVIQPVAIIAAVAVGLVVFGFGRGRR